MKAIHYAMLICGGISAGAGYVAQQDPSLALVAHVVAGVCVAATTVLGLFSEKVGS
jgi:hypothetical protein